MRNAFSVVLIFFATVIFGCGGSNSNSDSGQTKILASNVIFSKAEAAEITTIDQNTKVLAENVILDNSNVDVLSTNVQNAFEEVVPAKLENLIIGTWELTQYFSEGADIVNSKVKFNADGIFEFLTTNNEDGTAFFFGDAILLVGPKYKWKVLTDSFIGIFDYYGGKEYVYLYLFPDFISKKRLVFERYLTVLKKTE